MYEKKILILLIMCGIVCLRGYTAGDIKEVSGESFFFPEGMETAEYRADILLLREEGSWPKEAEISITEIDRSEKGVLYRLKICCDGMDSYQGLYEAERFDLGYFFVQGDQIYSISEMETEDAEPINIEEITLDQGKLVCQGESKKDPIEGEKGWHESIEVEGNQAIYHAYNDLTETGYYERFVWERGKGLVEYRSGYGAAADGIRLQRR